MSSKIILASASPRRADLLQENNISFRISIEDVLEKKLATPDETVLYNAELKAKSACRKFPNQLILGADTIVYFNKQILGKPKDLDEAYSMVSKLNANSHTVFTGVCMIMPNKSIKSWISKSDVTFKNLTDKEIENYLSLYNPLDKAGAYNIQEFGEKIVAKVSGFKSTVAGLPIEEVCAVLKNYS